MAKRDHPERGLRRPGGEAEPVPSPARPEPSEQYAGAAARLAARQYAERLAMAAELEPALRARAKAMPQATLADKRALARWVNAELRRFGLAIRCPKTSRPSGMVADRGDDPGRGRFQLYSEGPDGKQQRTFSSVELPPLELVPALPAEAAESLGPEPRAYALAIAALGPAPAGYDGLTRHLDKAGRGFRRAVAERLEPAINAHLRNIPWATYGEKQSLARWVNAELQRFGLAIHCPKTGLPAILLADPGDDPGRGRFQLDVITAAGRHKRTVSSVTLPRLALTADGPSRISPATP